VQKPPPAAAAALSAGHSVRPAQGESSQCSDLSGYKRAPSPLSAAQRVPAVQGSELPLLPHGFLPSDPGQWNIEDVYEFISSLPGGSCLAVFCEQCKRRQTPLTHVFVILTELKHPYVLLREILAHEDRFNVKDRLKKLKL